MSIPLATTTITVSRVPSVEPDIDEDWADPYDTPAAAAVIASGVRAHISSPSGRERVAGGSQEVVEFSLGCDPVDLVHTDTIVDDTTGDVYSVVWAHKRLGLGLDHVTAGLNQVSGVV